MATPVANHLDRYCKATKFQKQGIKQRYVIRENTSFTVIFILKHIKPESDLDYAAEHT